jgi:hypothetical protein
MSRDEEADQVVDLVVDLIEAKIDARADAPDGPCPRTGGSDDRCWEISATSQERS